jgi:hypothetical protein
MFNWSSKFSEYSKFLFMSKKYFWYYKKVNRYNESKNCITLQEVSIDVTSYFILRKVVHYIYIDKKNRNEYT